MKVCALCLALIHSAAAYAQLGSHEEQGLKDTKEFLQNSKERQEWIDKNEKAKDVDKKVDSLAGSKENKDEIYGIAADVMEKLTRETQGDPQAMQKILQEAQSNPQAFYNKYFDEKSQKRVRGVAADIEKKGAVAAPPK